jgi:hypothetical protein
MMMDVDQAAKAMKDAEIDDEIADFIESFNQPTGAACGLMGNACPSGPVNTAGAGCS